MVAPKVKICCILSIDEAKLAIESGASAIGLVSDMPSGPGVISEDLIAEIAAWAPPEIDTFLLTSLQEPDKIIEQHRRCRTTTIQLVDMLQINALQKLKKALPEVSIVQVVHVTGESSIADAVSVAPYVDALLLDSGNPDLEVKLLGGTGRTHNWEISRKIVEQVDRPVFLAGGLNPENISEAIQKVRPYGVDVCSGLRTNNALDRNRISKFFREISGTSQYS